MDAIRSQKGIGPDDKVTFIDAQGRNDVLDGWISIHFKKPIPFRRALDYVAFFSKRKLDWGLVDHIFGHRD